LGGRIVHRAGGEFAQPFHQAIAQALVRHGLAGDADHAELVRQEAGRREIVKRGDHQPMGEIASGAEDNEGTGFGFFLNRLV
jgi:hypothetical protein